MKIIIIQDDKYDENEIEIHCKSMNDEVQTILSNLKTNTSLLIGKKEERNYKIVLKDIYYFEVIDNKTFIYLKDEVYESNMRLYEIENKFKISDFIKVSKNCILNIDKLDSVKALLNGKYEAHLDNGEIIIISRHYVSDFKKKFGF